MIIIEIYRPDIIVYYKCVGSLYCTVVLSVLSSLIHQSRLLVFICVLAAV